MVSLTSRTTPVGKSGKAIPFADTDAKFQKAITDLLDKSALVHETVWRDLLKVIANLRSAVVQIDRCIIGLERLSAGRSEKQRTRVRATYPNQRPTGHSRSPAPPLGCGVVKGGVKIDH